MSSRKKNRFAKQIEDALSKGEVVVFVGPGLSAGHGFPTYGTLDQFIRKFFPNAKEARQAIELYGEEAFASRLHRELTSKTRAVTDVHRRICELPVKVLVTTNYDTLLESACRAAGKSVSVALTPWDLEQRSSISDDDITIVKLFGDAGAPGTIIDELPKASKDSNQHRLLARLGIAFPVGLVLFFGFDSKSPDLPDLLSLFPDSNTDRPFRILFTKPNAEVAPKRIKKNFDRVISLSEEQIVKVLGDIEQSISAKRRISSLSSEPAATLRHYRNFLARNVRFGLTVDETREIDTRKVQFSLELAKPQELLSSVTGALEPGALAAVGSTEFGDLFNAAKVLEKLGNVQRTIVVGNPGSGKTTLLKSIAYHLASAELADARFPVFLSAHDLHEETEITINTLFKRVEATCSIKGVADSIMTMLPQGRLLLLVDGLDELEFSRISLLSRALGTLASAYPQTQFIASCRTYGYEEYISAESDLIARICPLSDKQIKQFLRAWYPENHVSDALEAEISTNERILALARSPLFLTMLCKIWSYHQFLPVSAYDLYEKATELLLGSWDYQRGVFRSNRFPSSVKRKFLSSWAVDSLVRFKFELSLDDLIRIAAAQTFPDLGSSDDVAQIVDELEAHSGLIHRTTIDHWTFSHQAFQEFFCARAVIDEDTNSIARQIDASTDVARWVPVLNLAASAKTSVAISQKVRQVVAAVSKFKNLEAFADVESKTRNLFGLQR